ncbi:MAG TPA: clostripain-related cysteine peptidase, partial [Fimbriimonadaceae bacterium]|nr:clostripain-related cysteine peptidase [Fimbriimonadaceae bacterium]
QSKLDTVEQRATQLVATAVAANGTAAFVPEGAFDWSVLGGVGTVDQTGLFNATTAGTGSVRAVLSIANKTGATAVNVTAVVITQTKWTILVYINAANNLFPDSDLNVNQMETVADNPQVRFVLQWKQSQALFPDSSFDGVRRYLVKPDTTSSIVSELVQANLKDNLGNPLDMGKPQTLLDFINWAKTFYPADRYGLIIWNHGNGWHRTPELATSRAFSYDDATGSAIQTWEMDQAFGTNHFDFIAWDASLMQMIEVAYEARSHADFVVGSEESPPAEGYPYDLVFAKFRDNPDDTTANLTKAFVDGMLSNPPYVTRKITQSSLDTTKIADLATSLSTLAAALDANKAAIQTLVQDARDTSQSYSQTTQRYYRDTYDLCLKLEAEPGMPAAVVNAAADVRAKITAAVLWEGHNTNSPNSHGISIDFSPSTVFVASQSDYAQMKFATDTLWDEWLAVAP